MRNPFRRRAEVTVQSGGGWVMNSREPEPFPRTANIPRDVCRECHLPIEYFNSVWWQSGTCRTSCESRPTREHREHTPTAYTQNGVLLDPPAPIHDWKKLVKWLDS